jgi:hypothetical protein
MTGKIKFYHCEHTNYWQEETLQMETQYFKTSGEAEDWATKLRASCAKKYDLGEWKIGTFVCSNGALGKFYRSGIFELAIYEGEL